jgi:DNA-3-methyladenine glycosylase II
MAPSEPYDALAGLDPVLARLIGLYGRPDPFNRSESFHWNDRGRAGSDNFAAMVLHIVGQQISTPAQFAVFDRVAEATGGRPTPDGLLRLGADGLRACGLSRAKAGYVLDLAGRQAAGVLDVNHLDGLSDEQILAALTAVHGIGLWSAEMFLILQLHRPDILPADDSGIRRAVRVAWELPAMPTVRQARDRAMAWVPYRTYASALLWRSLWP